MVPENFIMQLAFTHKTSMLLTTDGRVFSWGDMESPCLGARDNEKTEVEIADANETASASGSNLGKEEEIETDVLWEVQITNKKGRAMITQIAAGRNHVLALDSQGNVYSWGIDKFGQLGHGHDTAEAKAAFDKRSVPTLTKPKIVGGHLASHEVAQIFASDKQSFAVTRQGKIFCWGKNEDNKLGFGFRENKDRIYDKPEELVLGSMKGNAVGAFTKYAKFSKEEDDAKFSERNPFKNKGGNERGISPYHEGYNRRTLVVDKHKGGTLAVYSANRVVQS